MLTDARFDFTFEILEKIICLQKSNVFFSPYIIYNILSQTYFDCCDTLEKTLKRILHIPEQFSKDDVGKGLVRERVDRACEEINESCTSKIANKLWIMNKKLPNTIYKSFPFNYQYEIAVLPINHPDVERTINKWVLDVTENIPDMLPQDTVSENDNIVLASAVRFNDVWDKSRFNPDIGALSKLTLSRLNIDTSQSMPSNTCVQIISTKLNACIMEKPFSYGDVSIFKLIPVSSNTKSPQTENLFSNPKINEIMRLVRCLKTEEGSRELRRLMDEGIAAQEGTSKKEFQWFWMEGRDIAMGQLFDTLGIGELLTRGTIDLQGSMTDGEEKIYFRDAVHRAKITTDSEGSYASASTAICTFCCNSVPVYKNPDFNVETPFLFLIYDKRHSNILFAGIIIENANIANAGVA